MSPEAWGYAAAVLLSYLAGLKLVQLRPFRNLAPLLPALAILSVLVVGLGVSHATFMEGGWLIEVWLAPATVALALSLYRQRLILKRYFKAIVLASLVGTVTALASTLLLTKLLDLDWSLTAALLTKSVTTPVALALAPELGAEASLAVAMVIIAGTLGGAFGLQLLTLGKIKNPLARGLAMGTASHALGTATALRESETAGALGGVALMLAALFTALLLPLLLRLI